MTKEFPVLIPLEKGRTYHSDAQVGLDFDEDAHPRAPKGGPKGGEFVKKDQAPEGVLPDDYFRQSYELKQKHEVEKFPVQYRRHGHPTPETRLVTVPPKGGPKGGEFVKKDQAPEGVLPDDYFRQSYELKQKHEVEKSFLIPHAKRPRRRVPNRQGGGGQVLHEEETDRTNLVLDPPVLIPFEKALPGKQESGHKTPPKGYPEKRKQYGDPENYKYPLDTEEHVRAAISYIGQARNRSQYSESQLTAVVGRIHAAARKFGIGVTE